MIVDHDWRDEHLVEIDSVGPQGLVDWIGLVIFACCWTPTRRTSVRSISPACNAQPDMKEEEEEEMNKSNAGLDAQTRGQLAVHSIDIRK